jgi:ABC-2 type transport system permease protein
MKGTLITLFAVVRKEFLQATRDRAMLFMLLVAPVIQIVAFGYAANLSFEHADTVLVDEDGTVEGRDFLEGLSAEGTFATTAVPTVADAERRLRNGEAQVAVVIPRGFGRRTLEGSRAEVQVLLDGSDPSRGLQAGYAVEAYATTRSMRALAQQGGTQAMAGAPRLVLIPRLLYNPALKGRIFMVPGTAASILLVVTTIVTAMGFAREREMGTLEQLLVTPIHPMVLMMGKVLPYAGFGLLNAAFILVVGNLLFDVPMRGPLGLTFVAVSFYLMTTLGSGLAISSLARTQQQALMAGFFFMFPALLLSGFITPIDAMPSWIRPITYANPMRWFLEVWRTVLLRGGGWDDVLVPLGALLAISTFVFGFAALRFRRTLG